MRVCSLLLCKVKLHQFASISSARSDRPLAMLAGVRLFPLLTIYIALRWRWFASPCFRVNVVKVLECEGRRFIRFISLGDAYFGAILRDGKFTRRFTDNCSLFTCWQPSHTRTHIHRSARVHAHIQHKMNK